MGQLPGHDWVEELRTLAGDTDCDRIECGDLVDGVERFLRHLEHSAVEVSEFRMNEGFEARFATEEFLDPHKRYALVPIRSTDD
jgi:hypothetical protein